MCKSAALSITAAAIPRFPRGNYSRAAGAPQLVEPSQPSPAPGPGPIEQHAERPIPGALGVLIRLLAPFGCEGVGVQRQYKKLVKALNRMGISMPSSEAKEIYQSSLR